MHSTANVRQVIVKRRSDGAQVEEGKNSYANAIYFYGQHNSPWCWKTADVAREEFIDYHKKLHAVKEQIDIQYWGLRWNKTHPSWSKAGHTYTPEELLHHLISVVIPLSSAKEVPSKPPADFWTPPNLTVIGSKTNIELKTRVYAGKVGELKTKALEEWEEIEASGVTNCWLEIKWVNDPESKQIWLVSKLRCTFIIKMRMGVGFIIGTTGRLSKL